MHETSKLPALAKPTDAGFDVYATSIEHTPRYIKYGTGIKLQIPEGYYVDVRPRSGIKDYDLVLLNSPGTIDESYTGEIFILFALRVPNYCCDTEEYQQVYTEDSKPKIYELGDRIAQLVIQKKEQVVFEQGKVESNSIRGDQGLGSTGTK